MSEIKRYEPINIDGTCGLCVEDPDGAYADYSHLAALQAELAALKRQGREVDLMEPVYQFQWREIGEGDWMACSHSWFRFCEASPEHDTRVVEVARPAQTEQQPIEIPVGAIENGRAFAERLEMYGFECEGGNILNCSDWQEFRQCFNHLAEWAFTLDVNAAPIAQTAPHDLRAIAMLVAEAAWKAGNSRDRAVASDTLRDIVNSVFDQLGMHAAPQPEQSA